MIENLLEQVLGIEVRACQRGRSLYDSTQYSNVTSLTVAEHAPSSTTTEPARSVLFTAPTSTLTAHHSGACRLRPRCQERSHRAARTSHVAYKADRRRGAVPSDSLRTRTNDWLYKGGASRSYKAGAQTQRRQQVQDALQRSYREQSSDHQGSNYWRRPDPHSPRADKVGRSESPSDDLRKRIISVLVEPTSSPDIYIYIYMYVFML